MCVYQILYNVSYSYYTPYYSLQTWITYAATFYQRLDFTISTYCCILFYFILFYNFNNPPLAPQIHLSLHHHSHRDNVTAPTGRPNLRSRLHFSHSGGGDHEVWEDMWWHWGWGGDLCFVSFVLGFCICLCIFILICFVCTSLRTTAIEWQLNCCK